MNNKFKELVGQLPGLLERLRNSPLKPRNNLGDLPQKGVYVFFEDGQPIYVGRTDRMRGRIMEHGRPSSTHNSATFAFNLAKEAAKSGVDTSRDRKQLEKDPVFKKLFTQAKKRVSQMKIRTVQIDDPIIQTLFEVYASIALKTTKYNVFDPH